MDDPPINRIIRRPASGAMPFYARVCVLASVGCLAAATASAFLAHDNQSLLDAGTPTPATTPVANLRSWAEGDNVHVTVTEFGYGETYISNQRKNQKSFEGVWLPLLPPEGRRGIRVVAHSSRVSNAEQLAEFVRRDTLTGVLSTRHRNLPVKELEKAYPGVDFSGVLVLSVDQRFPTPRQVRSFVLAAGVLLAAAAVGLLGWLVRWRNQSRLRLAQAPLIDKAWLALFGVLVVVAGCFGVASLV